MPDLEPVWLLALGATFGPPCCDALPPLEMRPDLVFAGGLIGKAVMPVLTALP